VLLPRRRYVGFRPDESIRTGLAHPINLLTTTLSRAG